MLRQDHEPVTRNFLTVMIADENLLAFEKALAAGERFLVDRHSAEIQTLLSDLEAVIKTILSKSCVRTAKWLIRHLAFNPQNSLFLNPEQVRYRRKKPLIREKSRVELLQHGKVVEVFEAAETAGEGANGIARSFVSTTDPDKQLIVKSPKSAKLVYTSLSEKLGTIENINAEIELMCKAHKCGLFGVKHSIDKVTHGFTWRMIMPKYEGVQFRQIIENIKHPNELVLLSLKVMIKLHELHTKRIVHGDFNTENILVKQSEKLEYDMPTYKVNIVDFGHSSARGTRLEGYLPAKDVVFAPELTRMENREILSDTPQDVYMLAYCLNYAVNKFVEKSGGDVSQYQDELAPLHRFIKAGLSDSPTARPLLIASVYEIKAHLAQVSTAPIMQVRK